MTSGAKVVPFGPPYAREVAQPRLDRDQLAIAALPAAASSVAASWDLDALASDVSFERRVALQAYRFADAMIAVREEELR